MAILRCYLAASARGTFEFGSFDQTEPGRLSTLGPLTNDAVCGLISDYASKTNTLATRKSIER